MSTQPSEQDEKLSSTSQNGNDQKFNPQTKTANNRKKRSTRFTKEFIGFWGAIIAALISAGAAIWINNTSSQLKLEIYSLQTQLDQRNTEILELQTKLREKDNTISNLTDQLENPPNPLTEILSQGSGTKQFEWQWAGENWYGRLTLQKQGNNYLITKAKVGLLEKNIEDRFLMNGQVLNLDPNTSGTFELTSDGIRIIEVPVWKKDRRTGNISLTTLKGTLQQTLCYAGRLGYLDSGGLYQGDIVLVDLDYAPIYASQLDDWFTNEQAWFDEYYVDRDR